MSKPDELDQHALEEALEQQGLTHLNVRKHGNHLVIYSVEDGERVNRARLTKVSTQYYQLGMANHRGKWESTPFKGIMEEIIDLLINDFAFAIAPW
ncbi:hypothetical protein HUG15_12240 [Salicibibacter cibarius]|uniref:Uncharacterized protein n=1 Tax=Salicibibacter cibarius TaxID=2743000 RepID=A0A7T7CBV2_9BACI|nr:hypothetical protein [Salicibibacter cibarius]QQK76250.1 hypothetical protein HUG15_12240 [Salicibibacter cibarius]